MNVLGDPAFQSAIRLTKFSNTISNSALPNTEPLGQPARHIPALFLLTSPACLFQSLPPHGLKFFSSKAGFVSIFSLRSFPGDSNRLTRHSPAFRVQAGKFHHYMASILSGLNVLLGKAFQSHPVQAGPLVVRMDPWNIGTLAAVPENSDSAMPPGIAIKQISQYPIDQMMRPEISHLTALWAGQPGQAVFAYKR